MANEPPRRVGGEQDALLTAIVPSLRVDVLGARAFKVSRAYFAKGVAAGRVSVGGKTAGKSTMVESGDVVVASGLGSFTVVTVDGLTRKGNAKVTLRVTTGG
jgi:RNA-binding protein YlmH